jgi:Glycosyl transferases group 1
VASLLKPDAIACGMAEEAELSVLIAPDQPRLKAEIAGADIVQFHFWNNVEIHAALEAEWPAMRSVVWCHVNGQAPPHIITADVFARADSIVASCSSSLSLPAFRTVNQGRTALIPGGADLTRLSSLASRLRKGFTVGYIGTLDVSKLHPDFVAMSASVEVPSVRFVVCGIGPSASALRSEARQHGERFEFRGYVCDIATEIEAFDVFGYPLCEGNSTTSELVLQEVMFAGIPPVVLPHGGATELVIHNETGLIASDPLDYARCLRHLFERPDERLRLGRNAADWVRQNFGACATAASFARLYTNMLTEPKRLLQRNAHNRDGAALQCEGAHRLLASLEGSVPELVRAFESRGSDLAEIVERAIVNASPGIADIIVHYRTRFQNDATLTFWTGLIFLGRDRPALAAAEFARSVRNGNPHARPYLAQAIARGRP